MKAFVTVMALTGALLSSTPVLAQFAKPEDAVRYRQSVMFIMQYNVGRVAAMVQGKAPFDAKVAAESAANAEFMSKLPWPAYVAGTDKVGNTRAKPEIWSDAAKFNETAEKLQAEMAKFSAAAKTGSLDNIKATLGGVGGTCKSCHDNFRKD